MTQAKWSKLLSSLKIIASKGEITPVKAHALDEFERECGRKLPSSYRAFCMVFGAGQIGNQFNIAVPGYCGGAKTYDLRHLTHAQIELVDQFAELGVDPRQIKRGIFFALDNDGSNHFFDSNETTDVKRHEYAIYTLFRDCRVQRTTDNFWRFITEYCLGEKRSELIESTRPIELVYKPISK